MVLDVFCKDSIYFQINSTLLNNLLYIGIGPLACIQLWVLWL